jgi:kynurenine formamidase
MRWNDDCPSWPTYPDPKTYYIKRTSDHRVNAQMLEIPNHNGTHLDGERHFYMGGQPIGEVPLERLITDGVVVDLSHMGDYDVYTKEDVLEQADVREGDALIINTGYHRYAYNQPEADLERFFLKHPGPDLEFAEWCLEMDFAYLGVDVGSMDHPMNTAIRAHRPDIAEEAEEVMGVDLEERFPDETYHIMHNKLFAEGLIHVENAAGEIDEVLNERLVLGCFPWRMIDVESSPCRLVAFRDLDP